MTDHGVEAALRDDPGLAAGLYLYRGELVNRQLAATLGVEATPLASLLDDGGGA